MTTYTYAITFDGAPYTTLTTKATGEALRETFLSLVSHWYEAGDFDDAECGTLELIGADGMAVAHYSIY